MSQKLTDIISAINNVHHRRSLMDIFTNVFGMARDSSSTKLHIGESNGHSGVDSIKFDLDPVLLNDGHKEGQMHWDTDAETLALGMIGGEVELQVGQELLIRVFNNTGVDIANGSAVYIVDAGDQKPRIALARADADPTGYVIGLATELIEKSTQGFITTVGLVRGLDTNTFTEGLPLYLSADDAGVLVETEPEVPNFSTLVGYTIRSHNNLGEILVAPRVIRRPSVIKLIEVSTPTAIPNIAQVYTKTDNKLYVQTGDGVEHEIAFV